MRRFSFALVALALLLPVSAGAMNIPYAPCDAGQFGCGAGPTNLVQQLLTGGGSGGLALLALQIAAGLAVVFIVWAGVQMVISGGDEGKITQYKWAVAYSLIGLCVAILGQYIVSAVSSQSYASPSGQDLPLSLLATAVYILRTVLNAALVIMIVVAGLRMLYAQGKTDEYEKGKTMMKWGIGGAILVNLAAALVYAVTSFFGI